MALSELLSPKSREPDETHPLAGGSDSKSVEKNDTISKTKVEIAAVTDVMKKNIEAIHERGERVENLQHKAGTSNILISSFLTSVVSSNFGVRLMGVLLDNLSLHSQNFRAQAGKVRRNMWWKNMKVSVGHIMGQAR